MITKKRKKRYYLRFVSVKNSRFLPLFDKSQHEYQAIINDYFLDKQIVLPEGTVNNEAYRLNYIGFTYDTMDFLKEKIESDSNAVNNRQFNWRDHVFNSSFAYVKNITQGELTAARDRKLASERNERILVSISRGLLIFGPMISSVLLITDKLHPMSHLFMVATILLIVSILAMIVSAVKLTN